MSKKIFIILIIFIILGVTVYLMFRSNEVPIADIDNFEECVSAGNPILEIYPRQCKTPNGESFTEDIGNELEKVDLIRVDNPRPNQVILNPLEIAGEARGYWYFESDFPIELLDGNGETVKVAIAAAQDNWMTEEFVKFKATLEFENPETEKGTLIFHKDNPSGLPENADELVVPVKFRTGSSEEKVQMSVAGEVFDTARSARIISIKRANNSLDNLFDIGVVDKTKYFDEYGKEIIFEDIKRNGFVFSVGQGNENGMISDRVIFVEEESEIFSETGNISINAPGNIPDYPYLIYEKPGFPANSVTLSLGADFSICDLGADNETFSCVEIKNNPEMFSGKRVRVYGQREGSSVYVIYVKGE